MTLDAYVPVTSVVFFYVRGGKPCNVDPKYDVEKEERVPLVIMMMVVVVMIVVMTMATDMIVMMATTAMKAMLNAMEE